MIELQTRPPSIPQPDAASEVAAKPDTLANTASTDPQESSAASDNSAGNGAISQTQKTSAPLEAAVTKTAHDITPTSPATIPDNEEDTTWPEDEFWD